MASIKPREAVAGRGAIFHWSADDAGSVLGPAEVVHHDLCRVDSDLRAGETFRGGPATTADGAYIGMTRCCGDAWVVPQPLVAHVAEQVAAGAADALGRLPAGFLGWAFSDRGDANGPVLEYRLALAPQGGPAEGDTVMQVLIDGRWHPASASFLEYLAEQVAPLGRPLRLRRQSAPGLGLEEVTVTPTHSRDELGVLYLSRLGLEVGAVALDAAAGQTLERELARATHGNGILPLDEVLNLPRRLALRVLADSLALPQLRRDTQIAGIRFTPKGMSSPMLFPVLTEALGIHEPGLGQALMATRGRPFDFVVIDPAASLSLLPATAEQMDGFLDGMAQLTCTERSVAYFAGRPLDH